MIEVIEVSQLTKVYSTGKAGPPLRAVDGIDFTVREGEVFGFLGPNGAGKTTTIRMLTGLSRPTSGQARVMRFDLRTDVARIKKRIGVVPERSNLYDELSAFDNLVFGLQLYGVPRREWKPRAEDLLARFRLSDKRDTPFAKLSRGMKRALTIAAALAHRPPLVFLDEPTTGLDVMSARNLRQMIAGLSYEVGLLTKPIWPRSWLGHKAHRTCLASGFRCRHIWRVGAKKAMRCHICPED